MNRYTAATLTAMTLLGEAVLLRGFGGNTADDIIGIGLALAVFFAAVLLTRRLPAPRGRGQWVIRTGGALFSAGWGVYGIWIFARYAASVMLDSASPWLPFITFGGVALILGLSGNGALFKAALVLLPITAVFILLIFGFSLPYMEIKYLIPYKAPTLSGAGMAFLRNIIPLAGGVVPLALLTRRASRGGLWTGLAIGGGLLMLCFFDTLAIFGSEYAATLSHPFPLAVSTASVGEIFSRCDPLLYAVSFFTCLIRSAACFSASAAILRRAE